jgi:hypothetical protein
MKIKKVSPINWGILLVSMSVFILSLALLFFVIHKEKDINAYDKIFTIMIISGPIALTELITVLQEAFSKKEDSLCAYKEYLEELGIIKIYEKRENPLNALCPKYIDDMKHDLDALGSIPKIVKMMGVALIFYFKEESDHVAYDIARRIREQSEKHSFHALICDEKNAELTLRDQITKKMGLVFENDQKVQIDIIEDIKKVKKTINEWKLEASKQKPPKKLNIIYYPYIHAPYATIIYINNHIYYTPNMPYEKRRNKSKDERNPNPSFCILRDSPFGHKLESLFDKIWEEASRPVAQSKS